MRRIFRPEIIWRCPSSENSRFFLVWSYNSFCLFVLSGRGSEFWLVCSNPNCVGGEAHFRTGYGETLNSFRKAHARFHPFAGVRHSFYRSLMCGSSFEIRSTVVFQRSCFDRFEPSSRIRYVLTPIPLNRPRFHRSFLPSFSSCRFFTGYQDVVYTGLLETDCSFVRPFLPIICQLFFCYNRSDTSYT